jgi:acyl-CoA synthetase (AMP-forming)/AMP-acid ligase II
MIRQALGRAVTPVIALKVLTDSGVIRPHSPVTLGGVVLALHEWGMGVAGGFKSVALRFPDRIGLIDELGELTFAEIERRSDALADSLAGLGVGEGDGVAILVRNHRGFLDASLAAAKLGADMLYLNTAFAAPQLGEVCEREKPTVIVHD